MSDIEAAPESAWLEEVRPGVYAWVQPDGSSWLNTVSSEPGLPPGAGEPA